MKRFLSQIVLGALKITVAFIMLAIGARFIPSLNWFFFQKNEHNSVFLTMIEMERILATNQKVDVLILGSSACEFSLNPEILEQRTHLPSFKFVTGGQTLDMSAKLARYLAPRLSTKFVVIDAYPRFGPGLTEEGVERAILNSPDASSGLACAILSADPWSGTTNYLWAARAIGTFIKPYTIQTLMQQPDFLTTSPGYSEMIHDQVAKPGTFYNLPLQADALEMLNKLHDDLSAQGVQLLAILPPIQNARIVLEGTPAFPLLLPAPRPDTCFRDAIHMRKVCVPDYTAEVAQLINQHHQNSFYGNRLHAPGNQQLGKH